MLLSATLLCHSLVLPSHQPLRQARPRQQQPPLMGGGIKQRRPTQPFDPAAHPPAVDSLPVEAALPRLVVFDLDNTLWTPELYTLRSFSGYADASPPNPVAGKDVWLLDGAAAVKRSGSSIDTSTGTSTSSSTTYRWAQRSRRSASLLLLLY